MVSVLTNKTFPVKAKVELSGWLLEKLISRGDIHGNECKCLDSNAKEIVWQSLLARTLKDDDLYLK